MKNPKLKIRDASVQELSELTQLCLRSKSHWDYDAAFLERCRDVLALTPARLEEWHVRVAEAVSSGAPVGIAAASVQQHDAAQHNDVHTSSMAPSPLATSEKATGGLEAELELMFVEPYMMRRGVGTALMADLRGYLGDVGCRCLWILSDPHAEPFYLKQGAVRAGLHASDAIAGRTLPWLRLAIDRRVPRLATSRLLLRQWRPADREPFARMNAQPEVARHLSSVLDANQSAQLLAKIRNGFARYGFGLWALERVQPGGECLGFAGLSVPAFHAHFTPCVELGWRLASEHWGQGLATEAARAAAAYAFDELRLEELVSFTVPQNVASRRVMEKLGMKHCPEDDFEHPRLPPDHPLRRHVLYRLSAEQLIR